MLAVTKAPVLKGLLKSAIKVGATFGKITPAGIARAVVAEAAFSLVAEKLAEQEFEWSDEHQNFVNDKEYTVECRNINTPNSIANDKSKNYGFTPCGGISATARNMPDVVNAVMTSICQNKPNPKFTFVRYYGDFGAGLCEGTKNEGGNGLYWYVNVRTKLNSSRAITQAEFDDIIGPLMDNSPTPYIEASADESGNIPGISEPQILILDGSLVQSAPYTNPQTGQAEQASWRFSAKPEDFIARFAERPETKPLYDSQRQVQAMEWPVGCIINSGGKCTCYSDQGTKIKEINDELCKTYVADGLPFNPYKRAEQQNSQQQNTDNRSTQQGNSQIAQLGGKPLPSLSTGNSENVATIQ